MLEPISKSGSTEEAVMPAEAGIQKSPQTWIPTCVGITNIADLDEGRHFEIRF
jgi:hypothetical protein